MGEMSIARGIRRLRKRAGMNVDEVGAIVGKSGKAVSAWETGRNEPDAETLIAICRFFEVDISYFYPTEVTAPTVLAVDERELVDLYRSFDEGTRFQLFDFARYLDARRDGK